jgi:hypothetical protein
LLHRKAERRASRRWALVSLAFALGVGLVAQSALAAVPTPESATSCGGILKRAKATPDDPYPVSYKFTCNWGVSAYTLIVTRKSNDDSTLDDFSSSVSVFDPTGNPLSTQSFSCFGGIPSNGINCNAGAGGYMAAPNWAEGTFDLTEPYCPNIPKGSPAGTKPDPSAVVQLVVSNTTGAQDGPFRLRLSGKCPVVHVKPKVKTKAGSKSTGAKAG